MTNEQKETFDKIKTNAAIIQRLSIPHSVNGKINQLTPQQLDQLDEATTALKNLFKQLQ